MADRIVRVNNAEITVAMEWQNNIIFKCYLTLKGEQVNKY